jgi:uncharacterized protein involved in exopolysaccharide biosynthesis
MELPRLFRTVRDRKWLLVLPVVLIGGGTVVASSLRAERYASEAQLALIPSLLPNSYGGPADPELGEWMASVQDSALSRTRLARLIAEFNLYEAERRIGMLEAVERMRRDIHVSLEREGRPVLKLGFSASSPVMARRVAEKITSLWIDSSMRIRETILDGANQFLQSRIEEVRKRLVKAEEDRRRSGIGPSSRAAALEYEALEQIYRDLFVKREELDVAVALARRQIGSQVAVIEPARLPEHPLGPSRTLVNVLGALTGAAVGIVLVSVSAGRRRPRLD